MTPDRLAEIEAGMDGIAPWPWTYEDEALIAADGDRSGLGWLSCCNMDDVTMRFVAAAPEHIAFLLAHIRELEAENATLREALREIAYNTSYSVPLGEWPVHHYEANVRRCIGIAANALHALAPHRNSAGDDGG